jgi:DNA-directed RNA polymerase specialized sigma subunit
MANYVNKDELLKELLISKKNDKLTPRAIDMLYRMVKECIRPLRYHYSMDKDDCSSSAMLDILNYWRRFDPDRENSNVFAYFTQIIKNGFAKGLKQLYNVKTVSIDEKTGIYNI